MGSTGRPTFGVSDVRIILVLAALLLVGGAFAIYQKSSAVISPDVLIERIERPAEPTSKVGGPERNFLRAMLSRNKINVNTAPADSLELLPGIGPTLAVRIIEFRESYGRFERTGDLISVSGIGPAKYEELKELITTE